MRPLQSAEVALQLKGGVSAAGEVQYVDGRGIGLVKTDGGIIHLSKDQFASSTLADYESWITGKTIPGGGKADHDLTIATQVGTLAYDKNSIEVAPGSFVRVTLDNVDDLQHNLVFSSSSTEASGQVLAMEALKLGAEGMARQWIPESDGILAASSMADPHIKVSVYFRAPEANGEYPYVCTFPGHFSVMKGVMVVGKVEEVEGEFQLSKVGYKVYEGAWDRLPDFSGMTPVKTGEQSGGLMKISTLGYKEQFGVVFTGSLKVPLEGNYDFMISSDDGSKLYINGKEIIDNDGVHGMKAVRGKAQLSAGSHNLRLEYFEKSGGEELYAEVKSPKGVLLRLTPGETPAGNNGVGIPLYPLAGEAMIYRNFIDGVGTARGIGVGFSEGIHYAYDAQNGRIPMVWRGGFIDAKRHWTGRGVGYQAPSETVYTADSAGAMLAVLPAPDADWPSRDFVGNGQSGDFSAPGGKPTAYRFLGYNLNSKRHPIFRYEWNGLTVTDYARPNASGGLQRTLTFSGTPSVSGQIYLRVGQDGDALNVKVAKRFKPHSHTDGIRIPVNLQDGKARININYSINAQ